MGTPSSVRECLCSMCEALRLMLVSHKAKQTNRQTIENSKPPEIRNMSIQISADFSAETHWPGKGGMIRAEKKTQKTVNQTYIAQKALQRK